MNGIDAIRMEHAEAKCWRLIVTDTLPSMQSAWSTLRQRTRSSDWWRTCSDAIRMEHAEAKPDVDILELMKKANAIRMEHAEAKLRQHLLVSCYT